MPNLVGIGNSQVPTNAMLGGLAYQDSVGNIDIEKIKAKTSDNAIDIFVYDTRKDSDGGAWRHRTQNKSWYNEGASATRGARKEFPTIAVLVLESSSLTIYDGDDPNLSMWMIFNCTSASLLRVPSPSSVKMLNAKMVVGEHNNYAGSTVDFLLDGKDEKRDLRQTPRTGNIAERNATSGNHSNNSRLAVGQHTNDVAMTVLPNAPIDPDTGLPIPTIAVATDAGISIIQDNDSVTVLDGGTSGDETYQIDFMSPSRLLATAPLYYSVFDILTADTSQGYLSQIGASSYYHYTNQLTVNGTDWNHPRPIQNLTAGHNGSQVIATDDRTIVAMTTRGLNIHQLSESSLTDNNDGIAAHITSSYNSGYMCGDIRIATLSETDTTAHTGNLVTNGSFGSDVSGWSSSGTATVSHQSSSQVLRITGDSGAGSWTGGTIMQDLGTNFVVGKTYSVSYEVRSGGNSGNYSQGIGARIQKNAHFHSSSTEYARTEYSDPGSTFVIKTFTFTATVTRYGIQLYNYHGAEGHYLEYDNIEVKEAVANRSPNQYTENRSTDGGLVIHGTIAKTAVATGAELVSYGPSNGSNFLRQSYNTDLNFGTNDFSVFVWVKLNSLSTNHYIFDRARTAPWGGSTGRAYFIINSNGYHRFKLAGGSEVSGSNEVMKAGNVWNHIGFVRKSGEMQLWLNGEWIETVTGSDASASFDNGVDNQTMTVNRYANGFAYDYTFQGMALLRISGTAPSVKQVKKMYNDEKQLFNENAKCTLIGTSDAVTAIAHDDTNDTLHVGTSGGRSDFRGLNRINNTTTAVTTAISASNGLVAEQ